MYLDLGSFFAPINRVWKCLLSPDVKIIVTMFVERQLYATICNCCSNIKIARLQKIMKMLP